MKPSDMISPAATRPANDSQAIAPGVTRTTYVFISFLFPSERNQTRRCDQLIAARSRSYGASFQGEIDIFSRSGPGSSTIRVRNPASENNQYVDPKKIPLLSIKQSATTIRISGRAARECHGIEPPSQPTPLGRDNLLDPTVHSDNTRRLPEDNQCYISIQAILPSHCCAPAW